MQEPEAGAGRLRLLRQVVAGGLQQLDRFAVELVYERLSRELELDVLAKTAFDRHGLDPALKGIMSVNDVLAIRQDMHAVHSSRAITVYVEDLVYATRPGALRELDGCFKAGVSVRAGQWLLRLSRARAFLKGRAYITPDDIKSALIPALRHRVVLSPGAELEGTSADDSCSFVAVARRKGQTFRGIVDWLRSVPPMIVAMQLWAPASVVFAASSAEQSA